MYHELRKRGTSVLVDTEVDVLVAGAGAAGMTAALVCAAKGLDVLLCEKSAQVGGTSATSAGTIWVPGTQQARDAGHNLFGHIRSESSGGEIVEEEQRAGALHEDVVHAVVDQIDADRVVHAGHERDLELRADAIRARHEHGILHAGLEREQSAERTDTR